MARADILAGNVKLAKLYVSRDDQPFRHANILGWLGKSRAEQRDQAITLAFHASLQFRPAAEV
jgi:hypothetical protein